jgi:anti-anti-sigma factor
MVGEYDRGTVPALSAMFSSAIAGDDADLVVDLSEVSFMDASTISVIIRARTFLSVHGRLLRLRDPSKCARRLLTVCDLDPLVRPVLYERR